MIPRVSQEYSQTLGIAKNRPETYHWRDIEHIPYLYFWINGRVLNFNSVSFNFNEVIVLRVLNILYSVVTLIAVYLLSKEFFKKKWLRLLPVFLLVNTLMFAFLSSSINYDNLANMFSVFSILFFVRAIKEKGNWKDIFLMLITIALGGLTKYTTLPLAFILILLTAIWVIKNWKIYKTGLRGKLLYLLLPLLILLVLNLGVYGVNLIKFHSLQPNCLDVMSYENCLSNGVFFRDNVTIPAQEVNFFKMISTGQRFGPITYFFIWVWSMAKRIYGIMGDRQLYASIYILPFYIFFFSVAAIIGIRNRKKLKIESKLISIISIFYLLVLLLVQNYSMYLKRNVPTLALQGRYIFPVISLFYILLLLFLDMCRVKWLKILLFIGLIVLFILGCWPFFFSNVDPGWFGEILY